MHYYQFNISDYQSHTKHLTPIEDICYRRLLDWQYMHEKPISTDINSVCRLLMLRDYSTDVEQVLNEFFILTNEGWVNSRAFEEIEQYKDKSKKASDAGKASAAKRLLKNEPTNNQQDANENEQTFNVRSSTVQPTINQEPRTKNYKPITINQELRTTNQESKELKNNPIESSSEGVGNQPIPSQKIRPIKKNDNKDLSPSHETWQAYSDAYERRYKAKPVRNATVNGQITSFIKRIGFDEAPHVAEFYVYHNNAFYVQKMHTVGLLLADAEKLRTEWATKSTMTNTQARQADKTQARGNVFNKLIEEARENATN